jgi:hypothetical protein
MAETCLVMCFLWDAWEEDASVYSTAGQRQHNPVRKFVTLNCLCTCQHEAVMHVSVQLIYL